MAITNAEMANAWGGLLGLTPEKVTELAGLLDQWALGGARLATWARLATDVNGFNAAATAMMFDWYGGTATGGPNGDGLYPLMNSEAEVAMVASPAKIMASVSSLNPKGTLASEADLPATGEAGDLWVIGGDAWGWSDEDGRFNNLGPFQGASALKVMIDGGVLPPGSTAADFGTWLANSQSAVIQPIADAAAASATAAAESETAAGAAQGAAEQAKADAEAAATATDQDRAATDADRTAVAAALTAAEGAATASGNAAVASGGSATTAVEAADGAIAARGDTLTAKGAAEAAATATGLDALATAADRVATGDDRTAVAADRVAADEDADATAADRVQTGEDRTATTAERVAAEAARDQAEAFRNQAGEIAGGDFLTETEGNTLYRKLLDLLNIADVDGLADALASKATPADVTAAINALVGAAPGTLDTIYELAAWAQDSGDALAALTTLVAGKASQADFDILATAVGGKASQGALDALAATVAESAVPVKATGAELRTGTDDAKFVTAKSVTDAVAIAALTLLTPDLSIPNQTITLSANSTLGAPTNVGEGKSGTILIKQDATGSRTLAYNSAWKPFGSVPALSTAANAVDLLTWFAESSAKVRFTLQKGGAA